MIYPNIFLYIIDLVFWIFIFITFLPSLRKPYQVTKGNRKVGLFFVLLYILFSFWGDWFHYNKEIVLMLKGGGQGYEDIYNWLIKTICFHYIIFRVIVWWTALFFLWKTVKRFNLNINLVLLFMGCGWISLFAYARVTLAMSIMFYGYSLLSVPKHHNIINRCIGLVLIFSALFFHKTSIFGIFMIFCGVTLSKLNKKIIFVLLIFTPLLIGIVGNYLTIFMLSGSDDYNSSLQMSVMAGQGYLQKSSEESGWGAILRSTFENAGYLTMGLLCLLTLLEKKADLINKQMKILSLICLSIIICASIFRLDFGFNTEILSVRFLRFSIIPIILLMSYFYQIGFHRKLVKLVFISSCCMTIYATFYTMYLCHIGRDLVNM